MFVEKNVKMLISFQRSRYSSFLFQIFFVYELLTQRKNYSNISYFLMRFTNNEKWSPFLGEANYTVFRDLALYIFHFPLHKYIIRLHLKILQKFSSGLYTSLSHIHSHWLPYKMLVALCLNKVSHFIMSLYKIYTMYSILKRRQCVFLTQSQRNVALDL